jgi:hypothetical protein
LITKTQRSTAKHEILKILGEKVAWLGFTPRPSEQSFYCVVTTGKSAFHVSFIPHQDDLDLTADVAIRIDAIEDLVNQYDTKLKPDEKRRSMTLGGDLGNIFKGRQRRWTVADLNDIPGVCDQVYAAFEQNGLPFLRAHSDVVAVRRVLVSSHSNDTLLATLLGPRSKRAIASTYILGKTSDIPALARRLESKLAQDLYLDDFRALCKGLLGRARQGK